MSKWTGRTNATGPVSRVRVRASRAQRARARAARADGRRKTAGVTVGTGRTTACRLVFSSDAGGARASVWAGGEPRVANGETGTDRQAPAR